LINKFYEIIAGTDKLLGGFRHVLEDMIKSDYY